METICDCCHVAKSDGISTGYGVERGTGKKICNECCGIMDKEYIIAENSLLKFGDNITINMVGVTSDYEDEDNIKNAIKYLKKLLK